MPKIDPKLYEFATVRQLELLEAIDKHGSYRRQVCGSSEFSRYTRGQEPRDMEHDKHGLSPKTHIHSP